jgi:PAS domain S-box-containing protein
MQRHIMQNELALYKSIFEKSTDAIAILDTNGCYIAQNLAHRSLLGYLDEDLLQKTPAIHLGAAVFGRIITSLKEKGEILGEFESYHKNGESLGIELSAFTVYDDSGEPLFYVGIKRPIHDSRRTRIEERLLRTAIEQSSEGIAVVDLEGCVLHINKAFAEMHGYSRDELIGKPLSIFHTIEQMPDVNAANKQIRETGGFYGEIWHVKRDREEFPTIMQNTLLRDQKGHPIAILGMMRDISEKKHAEEEIHNREKRLREVIDLVPHQIFVKDREGRILLANRTAADAYGTTVEQIIGKKQSEIHPNEEEMKRFRDEDLRVIESGEKVHIEQQPFTHADGTVHWLETKKIPIEFAGYGTCVLGVALDITARITIENALRESEERYKSLAEIAFDGIMIHEDGLILYANQRLADMFGYNGENYIGQSVLQFVHPDSIPIVLNRIQDHGEEVIEVTGIKGDGSHVTIEIIGADCIYKGHKARIGAIRDVTVQRAMENELRKTKDSAMLYLDLMCHDMRNQLQIMLGYTTLAEEMIQGQEVRQVVDNIERSIGRCDNIITKVNVTDEIMSLPLDSFAFDKSVRESVDMIRGTYPDAIVNLTIDVDTAIIQGNKLIDNVVTNLLENAIEHNESELRQVWVELSKQGLGYRLTIMDNGQGIDDTKKKNLLDLQRRYGGVGLHLVKRIVERMDGSIDIYNRVQSSPNLGAKFVLWFPMMEQ